MTARGAIRGNAGHGDVPAPAFFPTHSNTPRGQCPTGCVRSRLKLSGDSPVLADRAGVVRYAQLRAAEVLI